VDKTPQKPAAHADFYSVPLDWHLDFDPCHPCTDQDFQGVTLPSFVNTKDNSWRIPFDSGNKHDRPELSGDLFSVPNPTQGQSTGVPYGSVPIYAHEERGYMSQHHMESKPFPTSHEISLAETTNLEICEPPTTTKVPHKSQWATLEELRLLSRDHYMEFLRLTTNHNSRGVKILRRMYGSPKGMLDAGITTFGDVLDGQKPQSLKEIFAFTCLSYVMSKLLQKHGRIEGSQVLAGIGRWRLAIRKEKDRLVYDQVIKILWPKVDLFEEHTKEREANLTRHLTESQLGNMAPLGLALNASSKNLYVPSSMLEYSVTASSDFNFLETARAADFSNLENHMQFTLQNPDSRLDPDHQPGDDGFCHHIMVLLQQTSTDENFMFADFLNSDPQLEIDLTSEKQPSDMTQTTHSSESPSQMFSPDEPVDTLNSKKLGNPSPPVTEVLAQIEPLPLKADEIPTVPPWLGSLIETIMFQVVVEFMKCMHSTFCLPLSFNPLSSSLKYIC
jgi:hypothetical protein